MVAEKEKNKKSIPLKDILKDVISNIEKREEKETRLLKAWESAVGKEAFKHTRPAFLKSGRLVVNVSDSPWLYKLTLEKKELIKKINTKLKDKKKIRELQFRIGDIK